MFKGHFFQTTRQPNMTAVTMQDMDAHETTSLSIDVQVTGVPSRRSRPENSSYDVAGFPASDSQN